MKTCGTLVCWTVRWNQRSNPLGGKDLYPSKEEKAARIGYSLISNHAFVDGNKRIGMYILITFLETNGIRMNPSVDDVTRVGLAVASGEMSYEDLLDWIIENEV